jgi:hypothetical protein
MFIAPDGCKSELLLCIQKLIISQILALFYADIIGQGTGQCKHKRLTQNLLPYRMANP